MFVNKHLAFSFKLCLGYSQMESDVHQSCTYSCRYAGGLMYCCPLGVFLQLQQCRLCGRSLWPLCSPKGLSVPSWEAFCSYFVLLHILKVDVLPHFISGIFLHLEEVSEIRWLEKWKWTSSTLRNSPVPRIKSHLLFLFVWPKKCVKDVSTSKLPRTHTARFSESVCGEVRLNMDKRVLENNMPRNSKPRHKVSHKVVLPSWAIIIRWGTAFRSAQEYFQPPCIVLYSLDGIPPPYALNCCNSLHTDSWK